jgi:hypothetical protein
MAASDPGLPKRNPGLTLANAFSVIHFLKACSKVGRISTLLRKSNCFDAELNKRVLLPSTAELEGDCVVNGNQTPDDGRARGGAR